MGSGGLYTRRVTSAGVTMLESLKIAAETREINANLMLRATDYLLLKYIHVLAPHTVIHCMLEKSCQGFR